MSSDSKKTAEIFITKAEVTTQDYLFRPFLNEVTYTYFEKSKPVVYDYSIDPDYPHHIFELLFTMSTEIIYEERSIYTVWDLLGDVGGLFGSLTFLGALYMSIIDRLVGSRMNQFITS